MSIKLNIRPYARLLSMLGDQLIKNEQIAVLELIKNSYDADADWVLLSFENFNDDGSANADSKIIIEDNGEGMTKDTIEKSWMNPATPNKYSEKGVVRYTKIKKRVVQGEKGIGRYAMLKLGRRIKMTTCPINCSEEYSVRLDLSPYGDECLGDKNGKRLFLDELSFDLQVSTSRKEFCSRTVSVGTHTFDGEPNTHGTKIEISDLRGKWTKQKMKIVAQSFIQFGDFFEDFVKSKRVQNFFIGVKFNGENF